MSVELQTRDALTLPSRSAQELTAFPAHVSPLEEEALLSWMLRLGTQLHVPLRAIAKALGLEANEAQAAWWIRPNPWILSRLSERAELSIGALSGMTQNSWTPEHREDEAHARFAGRRFQLDRPLTRRHRYSGCSMCVTQDAVPYLRRNWLMGWYAICPLHECLLTDACDRCGAPFLISKMHLDCVFDLRRCVKCGDPPWRRVTAAHPDAIWLQSELLAGKQNGAFNWPQMGAIKWPEAIAFIDVIVGMLWTGLRPHDRDEIHSLYLDGIGDESDAAIGIYSHRYASLRFLSWITSGWPSSQSADIAKELLRRWLDSERNRVSAHLAKPGLNLWTRGPNNFATPVRERLQELLTSQNGAQSASSGG